MACIAISGTDIFRFKWTILPLYNFFFSHSLFVTYRTGCPNDVSDLHFTRPSRWCQLVCLLGQTVSHVFWGQNPQDIQHRWLLGAALLPTDGTWLQRPLLLLQHLRTVPCLVFDWCNHAGLVHGHGWDRGRAGTSRSQSREDLRDLTWLCPPGFWCIWWHFGAVGFPLQTAAQVHFITYIFIALKQLDYQQKITKYKCLSYLDKRSWKPLQTTLLTPPFASTILTASSSIQRYHTWTIAMKLN